MNRKNPPNLPAVGRRPTASDCESTCDNRTLSMSSVYRKMLELLPLHLFGVDNLRSLIILRMISGVTRTLLIAIYCFIRGDCISSIRFPVKIAQSCHRQNTRTSPPKKFLWSVKFRSKFRVGGDKTFRGLFLKRDRKIFFSY